MKEVTNLAKVLQATVNQLKNAHAAALAAFHSEVSHSNANLAKVNSITAELATANKEVEAALGETGSNFPPITEGPDRNGVMVVKQG